MSESESGSESEYYAIEEEADREFYTTNLYGIMSNVKYSDVILSVSGTNVEFKSHRNILGYHSRIFENSSEIPVRIVIDQFKVETVIAVLEFLYGKCRAIKGKFKDVLQFAKNYEIQELKGVSYEVILRKYIDGIIRPRSAVEFWKKERFEGVKMGPVDLYRAERREWPTVPDKIVIKWEEKAEAEMIRFEEQVKLYLEKNNF
uniref:BTB domain-containing protein n=1 Tax=Panagrolaimus davidi TaxID=227884 RepID=A0A914R2L3_9BILA